MMMIITAIILATGPSIDSRMACSGASQGIDEPAARAGEANVSETMAEMQRASTARRMGFPWTNIK